jgi:xylulokinase
MHDGGLPQQGPPMALVGGGARSDLWAQLVADALGRVLERREGSAAAAALGAARLGWMADGVPASQVAKSLVVKRSFEPRTRETGPLVERRGRFRDLYPLLQGHF